MNVVSRGDDAIAFLAKNPVDLVLLDVHMPGASGIEVLMSIQTLPLRPVVVMVTGTSEFEITREALQKGAFDYLQKPYTRVEFQAAIQKSLSYIKYRRISDKILAYVTESMSKTSVDDFLKLSYDEREVVLQNIFDQLKKKLCETDTSQAS